MNKKHLLLIILQIYLMVNITPAFGALAETGYDIHTTGENYFTFFAPMYQRFEGSNALIGTYYQGQTATYNAINQGFAIANLMRFYDMYSSEQFITDAKKISDAIGTYLIDLRYDLAAAYYSTATNEMSNYRYFTDNLLISWGLKNLAENLDPEDQIANQTQYDRLAYIDRGLSLFDTGSGFREFLRVDQDIPVTPVVKAYPSLLAMYLLLVNHQLAVFQTSLLKQYEFIRENMTTTEGGVVTIFKNGYTDDIVSVTNTMLFVNVALQLYKQTQNTQYLSDAEKAFNYVQTYAKDVSITRGYIETLQNNLPLQQSKSLFSHALIILAMLEFAAQGKNLQIDLLITWRAIMSYFRTNGGLFYSTISRAGVGSGSVKIFDNLMMLHALSEMPNIVMVDNYGEVQFSDKFTMNVTAFIPKNYETTLEIYFDADKVLSKKVIGTGEITSYHLELATPRPKDVDASYSIYINLKSEDIITDQAISETKVINRTGINLSLQAISLLSIVLIVVFVLFINKVNTMDKTDMEQKVNAQTKR